MAHSSERDTAGDRRESHLKPHSLLVSSECSQAVIMPQGPKRRGGGFIPFPQLRILIPWLKNEDWPIPSLLSFKFSVTGGFDYISCSLRSACHFQDGWKPGRRANLTSNSTLSTGMYRIPIGCFFGLWLNKKAECEVLTPKSGS